MVESTLLALTGEEDAHSPSNRAKDDPVKDCDSLSQRAFGAKNVLDTVVLLSRLVDQLFHDPVFCGRGPYQNLRNRNRFTFHQGEQLVPIEVQGEVARASNAHELTLLRVNLQAKPS